MANFILDISHHQEPSKINYDQLAKVLDFVIIRTQYGSNTVDRHYKTHHAEFKKRGVSTSAYAWVRGLNVSDMEKEAENFYNRTKEFNPVVWWLDVEEQSMSNMRAGVKAYARKMRALGVKKLGVYIAHHLYKKFNIDLSDFDAVWIPRYSENKPDFPCDLWQYTESGKLPGYNGNLDLNKLNGLKTLDWFTDKGNEPEEVKAPKTDVKAEVYEKPKSKTNGRDQIKAIQITLNSRYLTGLKVDGFYGPATRKALVKGLQKELNKQDGVKLALDGIWGPKTKAACVNVRMNASGNVVWILQAALFCNGYDPEGVDGVFGKNTGKALLAFQKAKRIAQDGIAGANTFEKLFM